MKAVTFEIIYRGCNKKTISLELPNEFLSNKMQEKLQTFDPKVGEQHICRKYLKCNIFKVTSDLLNSENLRIAITQLCHELHVCNFTML